MGKQIQHILTTEDEEALVCYLQEKFSVMVVDQLYPSDWDKKTLTKSVDSQKWIIIDKRVIDLLIDSSNQIESSAEWQIRSICRSCIEWDRDLYGKGIIPSKGRFFLDTNPNDLYMDISAATGDDIEKQFKRASTWLKKNCNNISKYNYGIWQSKKL